MKQKTAKTINNTIHTITIFLVLIGNLLILMFLTLLTPIYDGLVGLLSILIAVAFLNIVHYSATLTILFNKKKGR